MQQNSHDPDQQPAAPAAAPERDDDLTGLAADLADVVDEIREQTRWLGANLREMTTAFGLGDQAPTKPET